MDVRHTSPRTRSETQVESIDEREPAFSPREAALQRGDALGRYTVLEHLGSGAMGLVYAAYDSTLDRRVALKLLHARPGHEEGTRRAQRLQREAQAMAQLTHPNVVTLHDVGTANGRVFLAMEYVQGQTLTQWLATPRAWPEVIEVFLAAGRGLAAAHAKGLVHRDFKPDNVMIGDDGRVRVMDFGLARAGDDNSSESHRVPRVEELRVSTQLTRTGAVLGTPAYMAPEQHLGKAVDARSDQFAYCVALYEALYGARPFVGNSLAALGMAVTRGIIADPPPGRAVPKWLRRLILRGLSTTPQDRFADMDELLRTLEHDPRRRRRAWLLGGAGVLVVGAVAWLGRETSPPLQSTAPLCHDASRYLEGIWDENRSAKVAAAMRGTGSVVAEETLERVNARLDRYTRAWVDMRDASCEATRVRREQSEALLDLRNACLDERLQRVHDLVTVLEHADAATVERAVAAVADLPALEPCADVVALRRGLSPPSDPAVAATAASLRASIGRAHALTLAGRFEQARSLAMEVSDHAQALGYAPVVAEAQALQGELWVEAGEPGPAEQALSQAYFSALRIRHDEVAAQAAAQLTYVVGYQLARHEEGARWGDHALAMGLRVGEGELAEATARHHLGVLASAIGETDAASREYERSFALRSALLPPDHPDLGRSLNALGNVHLARGEYERALARYRQALELRERVFGPHHPEVAGALNNIALILRRQHDFSGARQALERAVEIYESVLGEANPNLAQAVNNLGTVVRQGGDPKAAEAHHRRALEIRERVLGREHPDVGDALVGLGRALSDQGRDAEAEPQLERALALYEAGFGPEHPVVAEALIGLGAARLGLGHADAAEIDLKRAVALLQRRGRDTDEADEAARLLAAAQAAGTTKR